MEWAAPRSTIAACTVGALLFAAGCDLPLPARTDGPRVVRITPDPAGGPVDRLVTFRIEMDRRIAPGSFAQGVVEITSGANYVWLVQSIDVVHPALLVTPQDPLDPDVDYQMVVHALRDLEGRTSSDTMPVVFHTSTVTTRPVPSTLTYADVAATIEACGTVGCHVGADAPLGLDLSSAAAVRATAFAPAREVAPSISGSLGAEVTAAFLGMPRIDPQNPARSYLLYTMLADPHIAGAAMPPSGEPASDEELRRMQEWIGAGAPGL